MHLNSNTSWWIVLLMMPLLAYGQLIETPKHVNTPRPYSPMAETSQYIGLTKVTIRYSRPRVTDERFGRKLDRSGNIWGNLVPYSTPDNPQVWRAGANENTVITFSDDVKVEGQEIKKGSYGLHMLIYENDSATVIFSSNHTSWGSYHYRESEDVLRVTVDMTTAHHEESLSYEFINISTNSAEAALHWERKRVPFEVSVDVDSIVLENFRKELRSSAGFEWRGWYGAAKYCFQNQLYTDEALDWAQQSVNMERRFENMQLVGQLQEAMGMEEEAKSTIDEALENARSIELYSYASDLASQGFGDRSNKITELNYERYPNDWVANLGMAKMKEGQKDFTKAMEFYKVALDRAPKPNKSRISTDITRLEKQMSKIDTSGKGKKKKK